MTPRFLHSVANSGPSCLLHFRFGSRLVSSEFILGALPAAVVGAESVDILIERFQGTMPPDAEWLHDWHEQDEVVLSLARHDSHLWLDFPGYAAFQLQFDKRLISVFADVGADENTLEHLLVDQVLPRYVAHLDTLVAHASAIAIHGRHALFLGQSGWGKSTLAGLLQRSGHQLLSDDCMELFENGGRVLAMPTYPSLRLLPDSLDALFPGMVDAAPMADYSSKLRVPVVAKPHASVAVAVDALYLLGDPALAQDAIRLTPLSPSDTCRALIEHSFRLDLNDRQGNTAHFLRCSAAARVIPAFEIQYPRDYALAPALVRQVAEHLASLSPDR